MATATQERNPLPTDPGATTGERITLPIHDMEEDLVRFNSVLDYLETHGDDDAFGVVSMMRPFATSLTNRLGDLRDSFAQT
jgi:hypothetical protein